MTLKSYMTLQTMSGTETMSGCGTETARGYGGDGRDGEGDGVGDDVGVWDGNFVGGMGSGTTCGIGVSGRGRGRKTYLSILLLLHNLQWFGPASLLVAAAFVLGKNGVDKVAASGYAAISDVNRPGKSLEVVTRSLEVVTR